MQEHPRRAQGLPRAHTAWHAACTFAAPPCATSHLPVSLMTALARPPLVCVHVRAYVCMCVHVHVIVCVRECVCVCVCVCVCMCVCVYACMRACVCVVCVRVYACVSRQWCVGLRWCQSYLKFSEALDGRVEDLVDTGTHLLPLHAVLPGNPRPQTRKPRPCTLAPRPVFLHSRL